MDIRLFNGLLEEDRWKQQWTEGSCCCNLWPLLVRKESQPCMYGPPPAKTVSTRCPQHGLSAQDVNPCASFPMLQLPGSGQILQSFIHAAPGVLQDNTGQHSVIYSCRPRGAAG